MGTVKIIALLVAGFFDLAIIVDWMSKGRPVFKYAGILAASGLVFVVIYILFRWPMSFLAVIASFMLGELFGDFLGQSRAKDKG
jgi:hypothetical protein